MEKPVPNKHSRRHSTGNLMLELTGYEGVLSRYLSAPFPSCHDNCKSHQPGSDQPTQTKPTRKRSSKSDVDSVQGLKKPFIHIPKSPKSPTRHAKIASTSLAKRRQDFKSRSKSADTDPFYIPPTRITRRFSDVNLPPNSSRYARVSPVGGGFVSAKRGDSRKDVNSVVKKPDVKPVKSTMKTDDVKPVKSTLKTDDVRPVKSAMKTDDVKQVKSAVKTDDVKPIKSAVKTDDVKPVKSIVKMFGDGTNSKKVQVDHGSKKSNSAHPVGEAGSNKSQSQKEERVLQNGAQVWSKNEKDETSGSESQSNSITTPTVKKTQVRRQTKENEELSSQTLKFKNGKGISSQSETDGPRKLEFAKGQVLVENIPDEEGKRLRRLTSDGVLQTPESNSVSVTLKPCDVKEKKRTTRVNNVIEETAGRLIRTRKSKVQALVGAFEMVSANKF